MRGPSWTCTRTTGGRPRLAARRDLGIEVAFGLQQLLRLLGCGGHQAQPLHLVERFLLAQRGDARQIEVALEQLLGRRGRLDHQRGGIVTRRRWGRGVGFLVAEQAAAACQHQRETQQRERAQRAAARHLLSKRIADSSPSSVSGNMRWCISCWTIAMLWRYCHTP